MNNANKAILSSLIDLDIHKLFFDCSSSDDDDDIVTLTRLILEEKKRVTIKNYCSEVIPSYSDEEFLSHFRLRRNVVEDITRKFTESNIYKKLVEAGNSKVCISPEKHIFAFLWFAGHQTTSFRDLADRFDLCISSVFDVISRVSKFLSSLAPNIIKMPNEAEKEATMAYYNEKKGFPHVIGSIDGTHIKIDKPSERHTDYFNRKDYYSISVQGVCNEKRDFIDVFIGFPGSVHDARVFQNSSLYDELQTTCNGCYLLGDSAYPLSKYVLTPYRDNGHLTRPQTHFNSSLSSCRVAIEHTFGILKQRFRQLYHVKLRGQKRICHFIRACCVLHNIANKDDMELLEVEEKCDPQPHEEDYRQARNEGADLRDELCRQLYMNRNRN